MFCYGLTFMRCNFLPVQKIFPLVWFTVYLIAHHARRGRRVEDPRDLRQRGHREQPVQVHGLRSQSHLCKYPCINCAAICLLI